VEPDIKVIHPVIPPSVAELSTLMPPPLATSEASLAKVIGRRCCTAPCESIGLTSKDLPSRASPPIVSPSRSSPSRSPTPSCNQGNMQLVKEEEEDTDEEAITLAAAIPTTPTDIPTIIPHGSD
ncbi:hypothetical protein HAX54_021920, partial [Datura stramonium]|nr:hypothetical protein [Datura stramonium]